ncbi:hypothetical protein SDJN02_22026 [Cucurbita argyrosperma subsp. argyrosperma]|nr:hypothetical protein SDJN02_22026 [Cucurbita argyrosperma subsp. argyrosperma]
MFVKSGVWSPTVGYFFVSFFHFEFFSPNYSKMFLIGSEIRVPIIFAACFDTDFALSDFSSVRFARSGFRSSNVLQCVQILHGAGCLGFDYDPLCSRWKVCIETGPSLCVGRQSCWSKVLSVLPAIFVLNLPFAASVMSFLILHVSPVAVNTTRIKKYWFIAAASQDDLKQKHNLQGIEYPIRSDLNLLQEF